jgi:FkbM family methyltransferase
VSGAAAGALQRTRLARLRASLWRFQTLRLGEQVFGGVAGPCMLRRRLFGFDFSVDVSRSNTQRLLYLEGERFIGERGLLRRLLARGGAGTVAVDVGANIGYYLLLMARIIGPSGRIVCFEPDAGNLRELRRNVISNRLANAEVIAAAVGAADGVVSLRPGINAEVVEHAAGDNEVPMVCLDSALAGRVDFLKIDVEGYEANVLAGARRVLREERPTLFLELHPGFLAASSVDAILGSLRELYPPPELFEAMPQEGLWSKVAARYLNRAVRRVPDSEALLAACRAGRRYEPFWAICRPPDRQGRDET